jgi:hypothetical protein
MPCVKRLFVDQEFSEELTDLMPVVRHSLTGVDCAGRIVAATDGGTVELRCNICGAVVGVVQAGIMEGLLGLDCDEAVCPHCGNVNTFATVEELVTYVCSHCGGAVDAEETGDSDSA